MTRNRNRWNHPVSALLLGLGVGAVLGILFAPKSGEETRDDVVGTVNDGIDEVRARTAKAARNARRFANQTREQVEEALDAGHRGLSRINALDRLTKFPTQCGNIDIQEGKMTKNRVSKLVTSRRPPLGYLISAAGFAGASAAQKAAQCAK